jgi:hypothetical protein
LAAIELSGAARLEAFVEKQLGKMHPTPLPKWDTYLWPTQPEPDDPALAVPEQQVVDLTKKLGSDGTLRWDVPAGEWVILRTGMTPTGMHNAPASPEGRGLEVDKMNRQLAQLHFNAFIGEVLRRVPAADRKAFTRVVADSYEMGSQNWTDGFDRQFRARYGYDPIPWLPVLTGRLVGDAGRSERFLWDLRRLVADRVATDYVGGLRAACEPHGLGLWLENYGHWGFPGEFLKYGSESDRIGGEYWVTGDLGSIECRAAASCANTYGKQFVSAEAFTGGPPFQTAPGGLKARGDWSFCEGVNHFVLHVYIQQPSEDKVPGVNAWFGTEFNRHNTWFERSKAWIDYVRRSCWLLQQGTRVADVAYFIGDDAPKMTGIRNPELPAGRDFDYINSDVIMNHLGVSDGLLTLPHGTSYRVLVLPPLETMRPELLGKVRDLVRAGATVVGTPPSRSPSMQDFPRCDEAVQRLATELWGDADLKQPGERSFGAGRLVWGKGLDEILTAGGSVPDFQSSVPLRFTHRRTADTEIYFVANPQNEPLTTSAGFRACGQAPELWWPHSGAVEHPAVYQTEGGTVRLPLSFGPHGSVFVVFRNQAPAAAPVVTVQRDGREVLTTTVTPAAEPPLQIVRSGERLTATATEPGRYQLTFADGSARTLEVSALPAPQPLAGPWQVTLRPPHGTPRTLTLDAPADLAQHPDPAVRHHSGGALYQSSFPIESSQLATPGTRIRLDLGEVRDLATVRVNGRELATLWLAPWQVDLTDSVRPGANVLEIEVVNTWNNRLVGDLALPADQRTTTLLAPTVKPGSPLLPAGLLGPVTLRTTRAIAVER